MSETASTIIKLLSSLVSPKTCVKYLVVAVSLVFSWVYVGKFLKNLKNSGIVISDQQADIVILLVGVGIGGLIGFTIVSLFESAQNKWSKIQKEKALVHESEISKIAKEKRDAVFLSEFVNAIDHLQASQIRVLRKLSKGRANIDFSESTNRNLYENDYVHKISCAYEATYITQINPLLKSFVVEHWNKDIDSRISLLYSENEFAVNLLALLESENVNSSEPVDVKWFEHLSVYGQACLHGDYERNPTDEGKANYELWFGDHDEDLIEELEKRNNTKYNGNLVIKHERLVNCA